MSGQSRQSQFVKALKDVVEEPGVRRDLLDPDQTIDRVAERMGTVLVRSTYRVETVSAPFAEPDGFSYPLASPRRPTARRISTLITQLRGNRPAARRVAVLFLGQTVDDPRVAEAIRAAVANDRDPLVRGSSLLCLGLGGSDPADSLLAGARRLVEEAPMAKSGTRASEIAWEGAGQGILGALLAAVRTQRRDLAAELRALAESLDPSPAPLSSDVSARRRRALLGIIDEFAAAT